MALEAGSAMHEVFAWVRWCTLANQLDDVSNPDELLYYHGVRLFEDRLPLILEQARAEYDDIGLKCKNGAVAVLETSQFYDDPRDKKRTLANLEECAFAYIDKWNWEHPIWVRDPDDPHSDVGIEIPFDVVVTTTYREDYPRYDDMPTRSRRYIGKIDGIRVHNGVITLEENKTASRLDEAWSQSMHMRSQVTGYCIAASVFTEQQVRDAHVHGLSIPIPKTYDFGGVIEEHVIREDFHINAWLQWFCATAEGYEADKDNPHDALRFTHSCSRYFRPCMFIPFCNSSKDEQETMLSEMVYDRWSPLDVKEIE